ncbi:MAG: nicotinamide-nucleotide amidohydrolase family protein [Oscillospiraceae bacterium]|nr:nicotinamide-nucleotide amidohydrolase family protein [Oscillospiraceae bacterium]
MELRYEVVGALIAQGKTVAAAESCTGGLLSKLLTDVPGSSGAFLGGVVSYTCPVKERLLGVDHETLARLGAVSKPVARQMAEGVRRLMGSDFGVSITGLAGPDSDGSGKPVGLVYAALAGAGWTVCEELRLPGDRAAVREAACLRALEMLRDAL